MADKEGDTGPEASYTGPESEWDFDFARRLMGKYVMASFNYLEPDGVTVRMHEPRATKDSLWPCAVRA
jgi:hypothetical protein